MDSKNNKEFLINILVELGLITSVVVLENYGGTVYSVVKYFLTEKGLEALFNLFNKSNNLDYHGGIDALKEAIEKYRKGTLPDYYRP